MTIINPVSKATSRRTAASTREHLPFRPVDQASILVGLVFKGHGAVHLRLGKAKEAGADLKPSGQTSFLFYSYHSSIPINLPPQKKGRSKGPKK